MKKYISIIIVYLLASCSSEEKSVVQENIYGLYKRNLNGKTEYLCISANGSYSYYREELGDRKKFLEDKWNFDLQVGESRIGFNNFEKYGVSAPILVSTAKRIIVIRMDVDNHSKDFMKMDSANCE